MAAAATENTRAALTLAPNTSPRRVMADFPHAPATRPRWWVPGDLDGFLGLGLDNLIQLLLIVSLCWAVLGYPDTL